jgi:hypothetical protein
MGAGTLIELIARGKQDTYLIGNPQFSYFKSVYRRCTNFSVEPIRQIFTESPDFGKRVTCMIDKKGDLLSDILLEIELPALKEYVSWVNSIGCFMIEWVELQLGGEPIDRITGEMLDTWLELTTQLGTKNAVYSMIGKSYNNYNNSSQYKALKLLVPLPFWFCRTVERSLPLISMQYTDVKIVVQFKPFDQCWYKLSNGYSPDSTPKISKANLICNYVYLDVFERTKFAKQENFEYLIEQFQQNNSYQVPANIINLTSRLFFNHPVKEIFWLYRSSDALNANDYYNYASVSNYGTSSLQLTEPFEQIQIRYNGNDRFEQLPATFFRLYEPYRHHSSSSNQYIYLYSFSLDPENMQPSGTCNFSKIDNATINFSCNQNISEGMISIYATNYNILRIKNGMCGLMFSS